MTIRGGDGHTLIKPGAGASLAGRASADASAQGLGARGTPLLPMPLTEALFEEAEKHLSGKRAQGGLFMKSGGEETVQDAG